MTSLRSRLHRRNWILLARFAAVGASGVLVNLLVVILVNQFGPDAEADVVSLRPTDFHVRWYHAYSTVAFFVANLWNFQLNRQWTFRSSGAAGWWREYVPFLTVGLLTQGVGLLLLTLLMHRGSPLALPHDLFDDSSIWLTRLYWAQLIVIGLITPLSFVLNKIWTFAAVRESRSAARDDLTAQHHG
ncbi:MAG: GtrA family protein [Nocardioides sp.]